MKDLREHLHRYWFRWHGPDDAGLDPILARVGGGLGCGVTAVDLDDAKSLIRSVALGGEALPPVAKVIEDVDMQALDEGHVLPNMGDPTLRGVWYPRLGHR